MDIPLLDDLPVLNAENVDNCLSQLSWRVDVVRVHSYQVTVDEPALEFDAAFREGIGQHLHASPRRGDAVGGLWVVLNVGGRQIALGRVVETSVRRNALRVFCSSI